MNSPDFNNIDNCFDGDIFSYTPPNFLIKSKNAFDKALLTGKYVTYKCTIVFYPARKKQKTTSFSENVILPYFNQLFETFVPITLWSVISMIKESILPYYFSQLSETLAPTTLWFVAPYNKSETQCGYPRIYETNFTSKTYCCWIIK